MSEPLNLANGSALSADDINLTIDREPRMLDLRLAEALGYRRPADIRGLISRHRDALSRLSDIFRTVPRNLKSLDNSAAGRPGQEYWLTKKQALYLCTKSETDRATDVTIRMVEVFDEVTSRQADPNYLPMAVDERPVMPFEPGSNVVRDLHAHVYAAMMRVQRREARDFAAALLDVLADRAELNDGKPAGFGFMSDWNEDRPRRAPAARVDYYAKLAAARPTQAPDTMMRRLGLPGPFEPGSNLGRDLQSWLNSALSRVKLGQEAEIGPALMSTMLDYAAYSSGGEVSGKALGDWDLRRFLLYRDGRDIFGPQQARQAMQGAQ